MQGRFGNALALDGQGMIVNSVFKGISGDAPRSVAMWVKLPPTGIPANSSRSLAVWGLPGRPGAQWLVGLYRTPSRESICTELARSRVQGSTPVGDGRWHHIVSVYYGGGENPASRIEHYVNGQLTVSDYQEWSDKPTRINTVTDSPTSLPLTLGLHPAHRESTTQVLIDEFYVFDHALSPSEIQSLYLSNSTPASK